MKFIIVLSQSLVIEEREREREEIFHQSTMSAWDGEHRRKLHDEFEHIFGEHERLKSDLDLNNIHHQHLQTINQWEEESIRKIQRTAQTARDDLHKLFEQNRIYLQRTLNKTVTEQLRDNLQVKHSHYDEKDLDRWLAQISEIRKRFERFSSTIVFKSKHVIKLIEIQSTSPLPSIDLQIFRFQCLRGRTRIDDTGCLINTSRPALLVSEQHYSHGSHFFRFRLEQSNQNLFFGIVSVKDEEKLIQRIHPIDSVHGWWNLDRRVVAGRQDEHVSSLNFSSHDEIILTLMCEARQITLEYPSMNKLNRIQMFDDQRQCSSPWKIFIEIGHPGPCTLRLVETGRLAHEKMRSNSSISTHCYCSSDIPST